MSEIQHSQTVQAQQELDYLLSAKGYDDWLYKNYTITNGDMLLSYYESGDVQLKYLREHGLPDNSEIEGI